MRKHFKFVGESVEKIPSFKINHNNLGRGIYVSRTDSVFGGEVTTFDIRMTLPNREPVLSTGTMHTIEHIGATFLRNSNAVKDDVIYFGPMGCRTGFYLVMAKKLTPHDILDEITKMFLFILNFEGEIPGANPSDCGNCLDMDLDGAKAAAKVFYNSVLKNPQNEFFVYPN